MYFEGISVYCNNEIDSVKCISVYIKTGFVDETGSSTFLYALTKDFQAHRLCLKPLILLFYTFALYINGFCGVKRS